MTSIATARRAPRRRRSRPLRIVVPLAAVAAAAVAFAHPSPTAPTPTPPRTPVAALGEAGGAVPAGTTVFDGAIPAVARLDPALRAALIRATPEAGAAGIPVVVDGGWRSPAYEDELRREAVARYGSEREAARWVATGTTSPHVSGDAVDVGPTAAAAWLTEHGAAYGLCRIYGNEPWHVELRPAASARGCPAPYADPTHDPRLRR